MPPLSERGVSNASRAFCAWYESRTSSACPKAQATIATERDMSNEPRSSLVPVAHQLLQFFDANVFELGPHGTSRVQLQRQNPFF